MSSRERKYEGCKIGYNIIESYVSLNFQMQILHLTWLFYGLEKSITLSQKKTFSGWLETFASIFPGSIRTVSYKSSPLKSSRVGLILASSVPYGTAKHL